MPQLIILTQYVLIYSNIIHLYNVNGLDNGLSLTPPMGWLSWERYMCEVDCKTYPNDCINEQLYMDMADRLANDGWKEVGYTQVNIDDCWSLKVRDNITNKQMADPERFPNGISGLADYVHSLGLKLGLYNDIGTKSCSGYTAIDGNYELDAQTFANWNVDMIKIDGCHADVQDMYKTYPLFGQALNATNRSIIYSCSWPAYIAGHGEIKPPVDKTTLREVAKYCNLWRNFDDVMDSYGTKYRIDNHSVLGIAKYWSRNYSQYYDDEFLNVAGPGQWNDPDMIVGGNYGLTIAQATTQFVLYSIFAAPLLLSNDLRTIVDEFKTLYQNKEIVEINQDPMGKQGGVIYNDTQKTIYMRELYLNKSIAIVLHNSGWSRGFGEIIQFKTNMIPRFVDGWFGRSNVSFNVRNLLNHTELGKFTSYFEDFIHPSSVGLYKLTPT